MKVSSASRNTEVIISLLCIFSVLFVVLNDTDTVFMILFFGIPILLIFQYWVATGREFTFEQTGITVRFLWIRKKYRWEDLKVTRFENYANALEYRSPAKGGALFSPRSVHKPAWMKTFTYCWLFRPFTVIFVYFTRPNLLPKGKEYKYMPLMDYVYPVDEEAFRNCMRELGVMMDR